MGTTVEMGSESGEDVLSDGGYKEARLEDGWEEWQAANKHRLPQFTGDQSKRLHAHFELVGDPDLSLPPSTLTELLVRTALEQGISTMEMMFPGKLNRNIHRESPPTCGEGSSQVELEAEERRIPRMAETTFLTALCVLGKGFRSRFDWLQVAETGVSEVCCRTRASPCPCMLLGNRN